MSEAHQPLMLTTGRVIFAITGVYITQSLIFALSMQSLPALVRAAGGSLALTGATTLFMLPWALKFIWAPWIERCRLPPGCQERRSRKLILRGQVLLAVILMMVGAIGWLDRDGMLQGSEGVGVFLLFMLAGIVASTIDIASDGFCVDQLTQTGYGWGNSVQVGGSYLGMMCGGGLFLMLAAEYGWPGAMLMLALLIMLLSLPLLRMTEPRRTRRSRHSPSLRYALRRSPTRLGLLLVLMLNTGMRFVMPLSASLLLDHGISMSTLGALLSGANIAAGGGIIDEILPGRAGVAGGLWYAGRRAVSRGGNALASTAWCNVGDITMGSRRQIRYLGLCTGLSLRHADVPFIPVAGWCRLHYLPMHRCGTRHLCR